MIRGLILFIGILIVYYAVKTMIRSMVSAYRQENPRSDLKRMGDEMVLDPQCRTYIIKNRAIVRTEQGTATYFCSDECARKYMEKGRI